MMSLQFRRTAVVIVAVEFMAGAATRRAPDALSPPVVTVTAREYTFDAPDVVKAGPTTIRLVSQGHEEHFLQFVKIASPHTFAEFQRTLGSPHPASWITHVGGVGTIPPRGRATTTIDFTPGLYAMLCDMEDARGTPHMLEGMVRSLTVSSRRNSAVLPAADTRIDLVDYAFVLSKALHAGAHVVDVRNSSSQAHMALLWKLEHGKSLSDVLHWMETPADTGPSPVTLMGGTPDLDPGERVQLSLQLESGHYVLICLVDDVHDHRPHYAHGMVQELAVDRTLIR